ncbi:MAG: hypothetical protein ACE5G5_08810 [Candidatus Methylomirabilales bacterium]
MDRKMEQDVRQRLVDVYQREGKVTERELLRISAITGVDYFTVSKTLEEIVLQRVEGQDSNGD